MFSGCESLTSITVEDANPRFAARDGVLFDKIENRLVCYPARKKDAHYTIPGGVTAIEEYAFYGCKCLAAITLPAGLTSIGKHAFDGCENLTAITIPEGVAAIGKHAFSDCESLAAITLPEGLTTIGEQAFSWC
jgi:lactocepin